MDYIKKIHILKQIIYLAIKLWKIQIDLSLKNAASSTEEITRGNVNYLRKRKNEYSRYLLNS